MDQFALENRGLVGQSGAIPLLVEVLHSSSAAVKVQAAAVLATLATRTEAQSSRFARFASHVFMFSNA